MKTMYEYIHFEEIGKKPRTTVHQCLNNKTGDRLGWISWNCGWRQYCFEPNSGTTFSAGCLKDIQDYLDQLNKAHKEGIE